MVLLWLQRRDWEQPGSYHLWQALSFWGKYSPHWDSERQRKPSHRVSAYPGAGLGSSSAIGLLTPAGSLGARPLSGFSSILATQNGPLAERVSPRQGSKLTPEKCSKSKAFFYQQTRPGAYAPGLVCLFRKKSPPLCKGRWPGVSRGGGIDLLQALDSGLPA